MIDFSVPPPEEKVYPAIHHFKIIADAAVVNEKELKTVARDFNVKSPLSESKSSKGGKYISYNVSVLFATRAEHNLFHERIKAVVGVKILL